MRLITFIIMLLLGNFALSQSDSTQSEVFETPEISPEFPGGIQALYDYLGTNIVFPSISMDSHVQGKVYAQFEIDEFGMVQNVEIIKGVHNSIDKEVRKAICFMPDWIPGEINGKCVKVKYTIPVQIHYQ